MTATARILIVEDQHLAALDCEQELARAGFECVGIANTAAEAMLLATRQRPDLILMDVRLASRTNGIEMAKEIYDQCGIRCLFVTGQTDPDLRRDAEAHAPARLDRETVHLHRSHQCNRTRLAGTCQREGSKLRLLLRRFAGLDLLPPDRGGSEAAAPAIPSITTASDDAKMRIGVRMSDVRSRCIEVLACGGLLLIEHSRAKPAHSRKLLTRDKAAPVDASTLPVRSPLCEHCGARTESQGDYYK
jgi:CheY-like chemotaxis protein